jgi:hypothetical protein
MEGFWKVSESFPGVDPEASDKEGLEAVNESLSPFGGGYQSDAMLKSAVSLEQSCVFQTSLWLRRRFGGQHCLLEWPPFEVLLISPTRDIPLVTLLAGGLCFVAFQSLRLASDAACRRGQLEAFLGCGSPWESLFSAYRNQDKTEGGMRGIPLRLLDCLGLVMPAPLTTAPDEAFVDVEDRLGTVLAGLIGGGAAEGWVMGEFRNADGEGMVIASMRSFDLHS